MTVNHLSVRPSAQISNARLYRAALLDPRGRQRSRLAARRLEPGLAPAATGSVGAQNVLLAGGMIMTVR
jgi:hypothetical protein